MKDGINAEIGSIVVVVVVVVVVETVVEKRSGVGDEGRR